MNKLIKRLSSWRNTNPRKYEQDREALEQAGQLTLAADVILPRSMFGDSWTDDAIERLHAGLFKESVHKLSDDRASQATIDEILEWVQQPIDPRARPNPFSFFACCIYEEVDPLEMQEKVVSQYQWHKRKNRREGRVA